jgi:hypothetical protein
VKQTTTTGRSPTRRSGNSTWKGPRLLAASALVVLTGVVTVAGPATASPAIQATAPASAFARLAGPSVHPRTGDLASRTGQTLQSTVFGGYATFLDGTTTTSTKFVVPKPSCDGADSGSGPGVFVDAGDGGQTLDAAGVLDQCVDGAVTIAPALVLRGAETNFTNAVAVGDVIQATATVGGEGTTVTVQDLTPARAFTQTLTGIGDVSVAETIGSFTTSVHGVGVPVGHVGPAVFLASTVNGVAIGQQSPSRLLFVNGCNVVLRPDPIDASGQRFTVSEPDVDISSLSPLTAKTGEVVKITGVGFDGSSSVKFGQATATDVKHDSATVLHARVPDAALTGPVTVSNGSPSASIVSACAFTVLPRITSFTPHSGAAGSPVTIVGSGFVPSTQVVFDGFPARVVLRSPNRLEVLAAQGAGPGPITVEAPAGSAISVNNFTPTLSVTSISPASGPPGTTVSITGVGFNASSTVKFSGVPATSVTRVSSTLLKAVAPKAQTGFISVTNTTAPAGTARSVKPFQRF